MSTEVRKTYRDSVSWQRAMQLAEAVYVATQRLPADERFGLTAQLRRAAVSIASNIAEGSGRTSGGELLQFLGIARGSVLEVETQLLLAKQMKFLTPEDVEASLALTQELCRLLNASIATLRERRRQRAKTAAPPT